MSLQEEIQLFLRGVKEVKTEKELVQKLSSEKKLRIKLGVDPTSPDLHLGHTVVLNKLRIFQEFGHKVLFIIGDFTALIGDPSGRNETRPKISREQVEINTQTYLDQVFKILDPNLTEVHKNSTWLAPIFDMSKLLEEGSPFSILFQGYTVQQLLQREDFNQRLKTGSPITFLEMMYPLFQGYDSVAVRADVELGGTDQLFNLLMGRELQRNFNQEPQIVMTLPLLIGTDGVKKMSKSYGNAIALNDPAQEMFGKIMSISDELMWQYYELLTAKDLAEVKKLHPKEAKLNLSVEITNLYHPGKADAVKEEFEKIFSNRTLPESFEEFGVAKSKISISHLLFESGLSPSKKESKRLIENGGVRIDNAQVLEDKEIEIAKPFILQVGKRKFKKIVRV
ncbi:MAG: tyrosine--tRNA ligase [Elusimicrobia bacterium]|nr:tyrosine--tRNA ligase [Elusimicrobiota bacterium]